MQPSTLDASTIRKLAVRAQVADSTFKRILAGMPVRPGGRLRAERVLRAAGLAELIPIPAPAPSAGGRPPKAKPPAPPAPEGPAVTP